MSVFLSCKRKHRHRGNKVWYPTLIAFRSLFRPWSSLSDQPALRLHYPIVISICGDKALPNQNYLIKGYDRQTGQKISKVVVAVSENEAVKLAGILIESVTLVRQPQKSASKSPIGNTPMTKKPMAGLICTNCGAIGSPKLVTKGSFIIEVFLWLLFLLPGIIYSVWRLSSRHKACRNCGASGMIPLNSPMGRKLQNDLE